MSQQGGLLKEKAYRLMKQGKVFALPGTGLIRFKCKAIPSNLSYCEIVICSLQDLQEIQSLNILDQNLKIVITIEETDQQCIDNFTSIFHKKIQTIISNNLDRNISVLINYCPQNVKTILQIIRFLQINQIFVYLHLQTKVQVLEKYQKQLAKLSNQIFLQQMILLQGISLITSLPVSEQISNSKETLSVQLLSIWKRTLPLSLASIVICDWSNLKLDHPVFKMHFLKNIKPCWALQFLTQNEDLGQQLACQCIGID